MGALNSKAMKFNCAISVVVCTHQPNPLTIRAALDGLRRQSLDYEQWELLVIDNASVPPLAQSLDLGWHPVARIVSEPRLGLTAARLRGIGEAHGEVLVFVDDDNVLAPTFLAEAIKKFANQPETGVAGGRVLPRFEREPPSWTKEFFSSLALCDHGTLPLQSDSWKGAPRSYPRFAPVGAGLAVRQAAAQHYVQRMNSDPRRQLLDRRGAELTSGGDNDLIMTVLEAGWRAAYWPQLSLEHLISPQRLTRGYLSRLNYAIARSWIAVLRVHEACPWPAVSRWTVPLRQARAFVRHQAWRSPERYVRWRYACGHFAGLADEHLGVSHAS